MNQQVIARGGDWVPAGMDYTEFYRSGYRFALRYVVPSIPGKMVTADEVSSAHAAKVDVGFVYETDGVTWKGGKSSGVTDGEAANAAMLSIDAPEGITVYHAVDSQVADSDLHLVTEWISGLQDGMTHYSIGVYGQFSVMQAVAALYPHVKLWQTPAWSSGAIYPALELYQDSQVKLGTMDIDTDSMLVPNTDAGFWLASTTTQPPPGDTMDEVVAQANWAWCHKCTSLFYKPQEAESHCPDGGTHDSSKSGNYILNYISGSSPVG